MNLPDEVASLRFRLPLITPCDRVALLAEAGFTRVRGADEDGRLVPMRALRDPST